ncbi:MAG TPA: nicotinate phosphoribosyltransferase [Gammaproteobacteria bacterium]|nr:nicotinate phosphoribosyltransferase [Gammaproteobacteria bacterium]
MTRHSGDVRSGARTNSGGSVLFTDLYELTMAQAYAAEGMENTAVFELFFRELPATRNYVLACGLEGVLSFLEEFQFTSTDLEYLKSLNRFSHDFLERLEKLRFTGNVYAVPEGTVVFPLEPVVQVVAPIIEAQLVETWILNQIHCQSVFASKAARMVTAAAGRAVIDFGARRSHGIDAALKMARASYIAGFAATSNMEAGRCYGIPVSGTMAHSYIQAHEQESDAFRRFMQMFPGTTLLVDTYDTLAAVRSVIHLVKTSGGKLKVGAVRLDSGDLNDLSRQARRLLDEAGMTQVEIIVSGGLNEGRIAALVQAQVPVNGFGVGTNLAVSRDAPELDFAYKLVEYARQPRIKTSSSKMILPGRKQVFRRWRNGCMVDDVIVRVDEHVDGEALLVPVMQGGRRLQAGHDSLKDMRARARQQLRALPPPIRRLVRAESRYPAEISALLLADQIALRSKLDAG